MYISESFLPHRTGYGHPPSGARTENKPGPCTESKRTVQPLLVQIITQEVSTEVGEVHLLEKRPAQRDDQDPSNQFHPQAPFHGSAPSLIEDRGVPWPLRSAGHWFPYSPPIRTNEGHDHHRPAHQTHQAKNEDQDGHAETPGLRFKPPYFPSTAPLWEWLSGCHNPPKRLSHHSST